MARVDRDYHRRRQRAIDAFERLRDQSPDQKFALHRWRELLSRGDPADEPEARRLASAGGMASHEIDRQHAIHFKPKPAAQVAPMQPVEPVDRSEMPTTAANVPAKSEKTLDERMEAARDCRGSFKGK